MKGILGNRKMIFEMIILTIVIIIQIVLFMLFFHYGKTVPLIYIGYFCWALSAIFGWLPIYEFKRKGEVPKGKSYVHTTVFVDSGVYSILRHPQFLAGILLSLAMIFIAQHWSVLISGCLVISILYKDMMNADQAGIEKFGNEYKDYIERVPRMNFLIGLKKVINIRIIWKRKIEKIKKILPPTYFMILLLLSIGLHFLFPIKKLIFLPYTYLGFVIIAFGVVINLWTDLLLKRKKTTVKPFENPVYLVTSGPFHITRNPQYLGFAAILLGVAINHGTVITFLFPIAFVILMELLFIPFEEKNLERIFRKEYLEYKDRVRQWL